MGAAISIIFLACAAALGWMAIVRQREMRRRVDLQADLHEGDEVMTTAGMYGTIREIDPNYVLLEVAPGTVVKMARRAVAARVPDPGSTPSTDARHADGSEG